MSSSFHQNLYYQYRDRLNESSERRPSLLNPHKKRVSLRVSVQAIPAMLNDTRIRNATKKPKPYKLTGGKP